MLKLLLRFISIILGLTLLVVVFAQLRASSSVAAFLQRKIPPNIDLKYTEIHANAFTGSVTISDIVLSVRDRDTDSLVAVVALDALVMQDLHYMDFLLRRTIHADRLTLQRPIVQMHLTGDGQMKKDKSGGPIDLKRRISLDTFEIIEGEYVLLRNREDSVKMRATKVDFVLTDALIDSMIITRKVPIIYQDIALSSEEIFVDIGAYEKVDIGKLDLQGQMLEVEGFELHSKYDKSALPTFSPKEREHISLSIPHSSFNGLYYGFERDTFFLRLDSAIIYQADLQLHLDKRLRDREEYKDLYSALLRDLEVDLDVSKVRIDDSRIVYEERLKGNSKAGSIFFDRVNGHIDRLSSTYPQGETTTIEVRARLMGRAPLRLDWNFDFNHPKDAFTAAVDLRDLDMTFIRPFMRTNLGAVTEGHIERLFFEIHGDTDVSQGQMKMAYSDFHLSVLKKDRSGVHHLKSTIGNFVVKKDSENGANGYRYGKISVHRDKRRSFFNYLWLNARDGIKSTLTGDGEKE